MKKILVFFLIAIVFSSCQSVKDGLTGTKRNNTDEFLVKKKNPLVQPPKFGELPKPEVSKQKDKTSNTNELEILLKKDTSEVSSSQNSSASSVEQFILDKIKNK